MLEVHVSRPCRKDRIPKRMRFYSGATNENTASRCDQLTFARLDGQPLVHGTLRLALRPKRYDEEHRGHEGTKKTRRFTAMDSRPLAAPPGKEPLIVPVRRRAHCS